MLGDRMTPARRVNMPRNLPVRLGVGTSMLATATGTAYVSTIAPSPVGNLTLIGSARGVAAILWENERPNRVRVRAETEDASHPILREAQRQLDEYFAGARTVFDLPLDFSGTPFQLRVWNELLEIPFGATRTYGEIATQLGDPNLTRAVGAANGRNPISIVAPCHRVIGSNGDLTGFAGGLAAKAFLLDLESGKRAFSFT